MWLYLGERILVPVWGMLFTVLKIVIAPVCIGVVFQRKRGVILPILAGLGQTYAALVLKQFFVCMAECLQSNSNFPGACGRFTQLMGDADGNIAKAILCGIKYGILALNPGKNITKIIDGYFQIVR